MPLLTPPLTPTAQVLAGVIEQRMLEPALAATPLALSAACFAIRTANTYLGSLLWVDFARIAGLQHSGGGDGEAGAAGGSKGGKRH